jgi:phosphotriesterase-related protein
MLEHINSVCGKVKADSLGRTLMHEHLLVGVPGWETHTTIQAMSRPDMISLMVDRLAEAVDAGFQSMVDPCPSDMGRDVELMREVADASGMTMICATGLYTEGLGASSYWGLKARFGADVANELSEVMIREIEEGVGSSGVQAGIIKVASGPGPLTDYEKTVFTAAAKASNATDVPITTHTFHTEGLEQVAFLGELGVSPEKIIVGHSCGNGELQYHLNIIDSGAYVGFDQFGMTAIRSDEERIDAMMAIVGAVDTGKIIVSHDMVICQRGKLFSGERQEMGNVTPLHFTRKVAPKLLAAGMTQKQLDEILIENPRRYFIGPSAA